MMVHLKKLDKGFTLFKMGINGQVFFKIRGLISGNAKVHQK